MNNLNFINNSRTATYDHVFFFKMKSLAMRLRAWSCPVIKSNVTRVLFGSVSFLRDFLLTSIVRSKDLKSFHLRVGSLKNILCDRKMIPVKSCN